MGKFVLPTVRSDDYGSGHFGAPRGSRAHEGIDLLCPPGSPVKAPRGGLVLQSAGVVYSAQTVEHQHYKYVRLKDERGFVHTLMYVRRAPGLKKGQRVRAGDVIGFSQSLQFLYPGMGDHVHYQVEWRGEAFDPLDFDAMNEAVARDTQ